MGRRTIWFTETSWELYPKQQTSKGFTDLVQQRGIKLATYKTNLIKTFCGNLIVVRCHIGECLDMV